MSSGRNTAGAAEAELERGRTLSHAAKEGIVRKAFHTFYNSCYFTNVKILVAILFMLQNDSDPMLNMVRPRHMRHGAVGAFTQPTASSCC